MEQRRAELLFAELKKRGLNPEIGESPPLSVKVGENNFAILFSQPNSDLRWTLGYSLEIKYDGYTKVFVLVEFQSQADKKYEDLFNEYVVIL